MKSPKSKVRKAIDKPCKEGQLRNPKTNRCVYKKKSPVKKSKKIKKVMEKQCKEGQEINPKTNRCVKKKSIKKKSLKKKSKSPKKNNYFSAPLRKTSPLLTDNRLFSAPAFYLPNKKQKSTKKVKKVMDKQKQCKEGQEINPKTNRCVKKIVKKSPKKKSNLKKSLNNTTMKNDDDDDDDDDDDEEADEYLNHFLDLVDELPFITYKEDIENGDEPYTKDMLIEDILHIITDIHKETNFIVVPDPETMINIATTKFDNADKKHNKEVNEFIFGTKMGNDGVFDKIRKLTRQAEKQKEKLMENRYDNVDDEHDILF